MRKVLPSLITAIILAAWPGAAAADEPEPPIDMEYTAYVKETYAPKGRYYQIFEDYDLDVHKRPFKRIGKLIARVEPGAEIGWRELENAYAGFCREKGADAVLDMKYSHDVNETVQPDDVMWLESDLIVYLDHDEYGHVGFWYHNNRPHIPGVRVEMIVRGSPADTAGRPSASGRRSGTEPSWFRGTRLTR